MSKKRNSGFEKKKYRIFFLKKAGFLLKKKTWSFYI
jgi:hypothetical protein